MFGFKKKYTYVDRCPRCGSRKTGYILSRGTEKECQQSIYDGLLNGELIETVSGYGEIDQNLFCRGCGCRWFGETTTKYLTKEEIAEQKEERGITENLIMNYEFITMTNFQRIWAIKQLRREKTKLAKKQSKKAVPERKIKTKK